MRLEELPKFLCLSCATSIVNDPMMVIHLIDFPGDSSHSIYAIAEGKKKKEEKFGIAFCEIHRGSAQRFDSLRLHDSFAQVQMN